MNILIFNSVFFAKSQTFTYQQAKSLSDNHKVTLLGFKTENVQMFPIKTKIYELKYYQNALDKLFTIFKKKISNKYNCLSILNIGKIVKILRIEKIDIIHAHFGPMALLILPIAKRLNIPLVVTFHGIDASPAYLTKKNYNSDLRSLFDYAKAIIIVSPHMHRTLSLEDWTSKVIVIPCCVDTEVFSRSSIVTKASKNLTIIHSGRLTPKKGVPDLIKVFLKLCNEHSNLILRVIGDGEDFDKCKTLIHNHPFENNVILEGSKPQAYVKKAMESSDIFVLNSRIDDTGDMEGSPVSILEAMSLEVPVVSTYHAGIPFIIEDSIDGLLVPEKDAESLYNAIQSLIINSEQRQSIGAKGRLKVLNNFTKDIMISKISKVIES